MSCIPQPPLPFPDLPDGISLAIAIPLPTITIPGICCLPPYPILTKPTLPLPPLSYNPAFIKTVKVGLAAAKAWYEKLPPKCPKL